LTNDVFGHAVGDDLLRKVAKVFQRICRADDIIARTGGDEYVILLPRTQQEAAGSMLSRISQEFRNAQVANMNVSVSLGFDTKTEQGQSLTDIMGKADAAMYQNKTLNRKDAHADTIRTIMETLQARHPSELEHANRVSSLCREIGRVMGLSEEAVGKVTKAGYLHDIGKITQDSELLEDDGFDDRDKGTVKQHSVVGYRILNAFEETMDLAEIILAHHECWDGSGYPKGIKGKEIPELARVIAVADAFDIMTGRSHLQPITPDEAALEIRKQSGIRFDPAVVDALVKTLTSPSSESRT